MDLLDDVVSDFIAETREGLEALDSQLVRFEQSSDDPATLGEIFRLIHTIKGTCGFLGLPRLQNVAHAAENVLGGFRDGVLPVTAAAVSVVLETVDLIRALIDALATTGAEPDGDDSALIGRLEAILEAPAAPAAAESAPAEPAPAEPTAAEPAAALARTDSRSLIDRLGGDATLDAAAEMAVPRLQGQDLVAAMFTGLDADQLQGALRDSLIELARKESATGAFARAVADVAGADIDASTVECAFDAVAVGLAELDVDASAIAALEWLTHPEPQVEAEAAPPVAEPAPVAAQPAAPEPTLLDPVPEPAPPPEPAAEPVQVATPTAAAPPAAAQAPAPARAEAETVGSGPAQTIRVSVDALEHLMTVVSELVLIRNQLIQTLRLEPDSPFAAPLNRLNQVTSELQEGVMTTRMQPISGAWAKLPRLVRDLAQELGKSIDLAMFGQETELDRQVLELIKDPLTHMIRNAADHGLETPQERQAAGKPATGRITLQARHEGGAIVIEVSDDGRGLPADKIRAKAISSGLITVAQAENMSDAEARTLIFAPGFSTASEVTSVSGRGVGMDVVRTNIEKIGGAIELTSVEGAGTRVTIRIPLTLTIVSALIVECCGERFAMPQSCIVELVSASDASGRTIEHIDNAAVLRLRDRLLPLISLQTLLGLEAAPEPATESCIVVARMGAFTFGVIVDRVFDTEEIVVKPVATVLRHIKLYSGATILGDGSVILILDLKGVSVEAGAAQGAGGVDEDAEAGAAEAGEERSAILVFRAANDSLKAAPLASVSRIEEVGVDQIEHVDGRTVIQYRGALMPIVDADAGPVHVWDGEGRRPLLVFVRGDRAVGLLVKEIVDVVENTLVTDLSSAAPGSLGSLIIGGTATELIDVGYYCRRAVNETADPVAAAAPGAPPAAERQRVLVIDNSPFVQLLLQPLLAQAGYQVAIAADAQSALSLYDSGERFGLILADTSRPDGARDLAQAFGRAADWHQTPMLSLALHQGSAGEPPAGFNRTTLLEAVSEALGEARAA